MCIGSEQASDFGISFVYQKRLVSDTLPELNNASIGNYAVSLEGLLRLLLVTYLGPSNSVLNDRSSTSDSLASHPFGSPQSSASIFCSEKRRARCHARQNYPFTSSVVQCLCLHWSVSKCSTSSLVSQEDSEGHWIRRTHPTGHRPTLDLRFTLLVTILNRHAKLSTICISTVTASGPGGVLDQQQIFPYPPR